MSAQRVIEYAVVIQLPLPLQLRPDEDPLSSTFPCKVTARWPPKDHSDNKLEGSYELFAFPAGIRLEASQRGSALPPAAFHSFVQTKQDGARVYGFCMVRHDLLPAEGVAAVKTQLGRKLMQRNAREEVKLPDRIHAPQCLCLLSMHPMHNMFRDAMLAMKWDSWVDVSVAERVYNEVAQLKLSSSLSMSQELPAVDIDYMCLFRQLDPNNLLLVWNAILCERKILILGDLQQLTPTIEALLSLLYPLVWTHAYIPLLPLVVIDYIQAPFPCIIGLERKSLVSLDEVSSTEDVVIVDLEKNMVVAAPNNAEQLPPQLSAMLLSVCNRFNVETIYPDAPQEKDKETMLLSDSESDEEDESSGSIEMVYSNEMGWHLVNKANMKGCRASNVLTKQDPVKNLREGFLSVFVSLLKHYKEHVNLPAGGKGDGLKDLFQNEQFLADVEPSSVNFMSILVETQLFAYFVQERIIRQEDDLFDRKVNESLTRQKERDKSLQKKDKSGELLCRVEVKTNDYVLKSWKKQFVKLRGNTIQIFNSDEDTQVVTNFTIVPRLSKVSLPVSKELFPTKYPFEIFTNHVCVGLCADTAKKRRQWMKYIKARIRGGAAIPNPRVIRQSDAYATIQGELVLKRKVGISSFYQDWRATAQLAMKNDKKGDSLERTSLAEIIRSRAEQETPLAPSKDDALLSQGKQSCNMTGAAIKQCLESLGGHISNVSMEEAMFIGRMMRILQTVLHAPEVDSPFNIPDKPVFRSSEGQPSGKLVTLQEVISCVFREIQTGVATFLSEVPSLNTVEAVASMSKRLEKIKKLLDHTMPVNAPAVTVSKKSSKNDEEMLLAFKRLDFQAILQSVSQTKDKIAHETVAADEVIFLAKIARSMRKMIQERSIDSTVDSLSPRGASPGILPESKLMQLKSMTAAAYEEINSELIQLQGKLQETQSLEDAVLIAKVVRNAARFHNDSLKR